jgi:hypothetical protein
MVIRILLLTLLVSACGREVNLKANKLESTQQITNADIAKYQKSGTFVKSTNAVVVSGVSYKVSAYSSKNALDFVAAIPAGSQVPVLVVGGYSANEVVIESIVRQ